jgi:hypothetical protein
MSLEQLIDAMEDAGSVDLRGSQVLPLMLDVIRQGPGVPAGLQSQVDQLQAWVNSGAHRRDDDQNGSYDHAAAVQLMDAWWPRALEATFKPTLGDDLFNKVKAQMAFDDAPGPLGSAYISGWYGYLNKDLRALLGRPVTDAFSRGYCGGGDLAACRTALVNSLQDAAGVSAGELYPEAGNCFTGDIGDSQMCHDAIRFRTVGAVGVDPIEWINRPTWQQVVEIQGHRGRGADLAGPSPDAGSGTGTPAPPGRCATVLVGSLKRDRLRGTGDSERLVGRRGKDRVLGLEGDDCLFGNKGVDALYGGPGDDLLNGGNERDRLNGGNGTDLIIGGAGPDLVKARDGVRDAIRCGKDRDVVKADRLDKARGCERVERPKKGT